VLNTGIVGQLQKKVHNLIDAPLMRDNYEKILELGAGDLVHLSQFSKKFEFYEVTDLRFSKKKIQELRKKVKTDFADVNNKVTFSELDAQNGDITENSQDLIIATCLLIHLNSPQVALKKWKRGLRKNGELVIYIPCDPGMLLRLSRFFFTKPKQRRAGISNPSLLYALEHVTSFEVLKQLVNYEFEDFRIDVKYWPFPLIRSWNLNLFAIFHISEK
jgi:ubiquinone/menaquinone biosynthesis C-methylase UbiE